MARKPNTTETAQITISLTNLQKTFLAALTDTEQYGRNVAETARFLLAEKINEMIKAGELDRVMSTAATLRAYESPVLRSGAATAPDSP